MRDRRSPASSSAEEGGSVATSSTRLGFERQVRDALLHLHDPGHLQSHPLTRYLEPPTSPRPSSLGRALRQSLLDAVESLRPTAEVSTSSHASRSYQILKLRYVDALEVSQVEDRLSLSRSLYYLEQRRAIEGVSAVLWEWWGLGEGRETSAKPSERAEERDVGSAVRDRLTNLPLQLTSFVGREREMAEVRRLLDTTRLLTLTGTGGCGKTRLAYRVAEGLLAEHSEQYPDGVWTVELASLSDPALVPQVVASTLDVRETPSRPILESLLSHLKASRLLLVLDNCEHLLDACARLADSLLRGCPGVLILATSREPLGISGETSYRVPSLSLPDLQHLPPLDRLTEYEAVRLFVERATAAQPTFSATDQNARALARVCWRLDGIPLAIELAAARVRGLSVEQLAGRLDDRFRLLTGGSRAALLRQQTLRATIDWSHDLLSDPEKTLFRRLAVFAGGFTLEAAEEVCTGDWQGGTIERGDILGLLLRLVERSLVVAEEASGEVRYQLLETLRQYAQERLVESGENVEVPRRHRDFYLALAERALPEIVRADPLPWLRTLEQEDDNLRAALDWSQTEPDGAASELRLALPLGYAWYYRGLFHKESRKLIGSIVARSVGVLPGTRSSLLHIAAIYEAGEGNLARARSYHEEGLALARAVGDPQLVGQSLLCQAFVEIDYGHVDEARALLERALPLARESGDQSGVGDILMFLAELRGQQDDAGAVPLFEEAAAIAQTEGNWGQYATIRLKQGQLMLERGDLSRARALIEEALVSWRGGPKTKTIHPMITWGDLARAEGDLDRAGALYREALVQARDQGSATWIAMCVGRLAGLSVAKGLNVRAVRIYGSLAAWYASVGMPVPYKPRPDHDRDLSSARSALGEEAFARVWAAGQAMTLEQAVEYALQDGSG